MSVEIKYLTVLLSKSWSVPDTQIIVYLVTNHEIESNLSSTSFTTLGLYTELSERF